VTSGSELRLVLASANPDKSAEIVDILGEVSGLVLLPRPGGIPDVVEDGETLADNARLMGVAFLVATGEPGVADDTGLEVTALGGAPGVYSARFAGEDATYADNVAKLVRELAAAGAVEPSQRSARFRTVALVAFPGGDELVAEGEVIGSIAPEPVGAGGFGYDPLFVPDGGGGRTFAQMSPSEKHRLSHRGRAFRALADRLRGYRA
jgi:XTP/dITP diphosphohydrolase